MPKRVSRPVRGTLHFLKGKDSVELVQLHALPYRDPTKYPDPWAGDVLAGRGPLIALVLKYASAKQIEDAMATRRRPKAQSTLATPHSLQALRAKINSKYGH